MGNTVSNEGKEVATMKSNHTAKTGGRDDECLKITLKPDKWENAAYSKDLTLGRSNKTFIEGAPICLKRTWIGPFSKPFHSGILGGTTSGTFWFEAQATKASPNLIIEGSPAVRTDDPTTQNHGNCDGKVISGYYEPSAESAEEYAKRICNIAEFEGKGTLTGRMVGYETLSNKAAKEYLDIYDKENVIFKTLRKDTSDSEAVENPECPLTGKHTRWYVKGTKFPLFAQTFEDDDEGVETFTVKGADFINPLILKMMGWKKGTDPEPDESGVETDKAGGAQDYNREWGGDRDLKDLGDAKHTPKADGGYSMGGLRMRTPQESTPEKQQQRLDEKKQQYKDAYSGGKKKTMTAPINLADMTTSVNEIKKAIIYLMWAALAPNVEVTATSCGSSRKARLRVYPYNNLKVQLSLPVMKWARKGARGASRWAKNRKQQAAKNAKQARRDYNDAKRNNNKYRKRLKQKPNNEDRQNNLKNAIAQKRDAAAIKAKFEKHEKTFKMVVDGLNGTRKMLIALEKIARVSGERMDVKFLEDFGLELVVEYLPCEDTAKPDKTNKPKTKHMLGRKWTLGFEAEPLIGVNFSVQFSLLNFIVPFAGQLAGKLLRRFKIVRVDVFFSVGFGVSANVSGSWDQNDKVSYNGVKYTFDMNPALGIAAGVAGIDIVRLTVSFPNQVELGFVEPVKAGEMLRGEWTWQLRTHIELLLFADSWFEIEAGSWSPKVLRAGPTRKRQLTLLASPF